MPGRVDLTSVYRTLAAIAPVFGLSPGVMATLRAMIACVRPEKGMVCFASTGTLLRLRSGGSDRTIRRHAEQLIQAGVLARNDSPNGKRYAMRDASTGDSIAYGFDLSPMTERESVWSEIAESLAAEESRRKYLRTIILGRLHRLDLIESGHDTAELRKILRRKSITLVELEGHLSTVEDLLTDLEPRRLSAPPALPATPVTAGDDGERGDEVADIVQGAAMASSGGQNVRHQSRSETEQPDSNCSPSGNVGYEDSAELLRMTLGCCTEALSFAQEMPRSWGDIKRLAMMLGPMIGIDRDMIIEASEVNGDVSASLTVLLVLQMGGRIVNHGAYYRSVMLGRRRNDFDLARCLERLSLKAWSA